MGVAIGRAMIIDGLCIVNYNYNAAKLKHGSEVYDFHDHESLECCNSSCEIDIEHVWDENLEMFDDEEMINITFDNDDEEVNYISFDENGVIDDNMLNEQEKHPLADQNCPFVIQIFLTNYNDIDLDILKIYESKLNFLLQHHYSKVQDL